MICTCVNGHCADPKWMTRGCLQDTAQIQSCVHHQSVDACKDKETNEFSIHLTSPAPQLVYALYD